MGETQIEFVIVVDHDDADAVERRLRSIAAMYLAERWSLSSHPAPTSIHSRPEEEQ